MEVVWKKEGRYALNIGRLIVPCLNVARDRVERQRALNRCDLLQRTFFFKCFKRCRIPNNYLNLE